MNIHERLNCAAMQRRDWTVWENGKLVWRKRTHPQQMHPADFIRSILED